MNPFKSQFRIRIDYVITSGSSLFAGHLTLAQKPAGPQADGRGVRRSILPPEVSADKDIVRGTKSHRSFAQPVQVRLILTENKEKLHTFFGNSSMPERRKDQ